MYILHYLRSISPLSCLLSKDDDNQVFNNRSMVVVCLVVQLYHFVWYLVNMSTFYYILMHTLSYNDHQMYICIYQSQWILFI